VSVNQHALGGSDARTEFESYVPGLLIIAVVMLVFTVAMAVAREVEAGTLRRLTLTRMTAFDFLAGVSAAQVAIGVTALLLTFLAAWALGFRSVGPLWAAALVGAVTSLAVVGVGLIVACFARTVTKAFLVANLPFLLLMFFSGAIYPIPKVELFSVGTRTVGLWDILPPTHAIVALNKILSLGTGLSEVAYELIVLLVLSGVYFGVGVWLFHRRHLQPE
jgi:ABC-2 type transport system permease protein